MDAFFVNTGGDGTPGPMSGEVVKDGYNTNFDIIDREFKNRRTITGIDALTQDDDNALIKLNSASSFDITLNQLAAGTKISFYNVGAGAVTFTNGSGVTVLGSPSISGAIGTSYPTAIVNYESLTSPRVINAGTSSGGGGGTGDVVGPASATNNVPVLFDGTTGKLIKDSTPTGTGNPVMDTSPTLVTPALGTPTALVLTNATGLVTAGINNSQVTLAKIANAAANSKLLGAGASGSGSAYAEITLGTNLSMSGTTLNATGGGGGSGDVVGPSSATDSAFALFDGTTGKLIKDSAKTLTSKSDANINSASVSSGTMTLDCTGLVGDVQFNASTSISADFALALSNTTNVRSITLTFLLNTGTTIDIAMATSVVAEKGDSRWTNTSGSESLALTPPDSGNPYVLSFLKCGSLWLLRASGAFYTS